MLLTAEPVALKTRFADVRRTTEQLAVPLSSEDQTAQSMPDASPTKWHRAHTSWFFEEFVLAPRGAYQVFDPTFRYLFNSYYEAVGPRHPRPQRGLVTRPGVVEIARYRAYVDRAMAELLASVDDTSSGGLIDLGCHHEQQHQELLPMDAKQLLAGPPFAPVYVARPVEEDVDAVPLTWRGLDGGLHEIGHTGDGFAFDNEGPRHVVHLQPFEIAQRAVTNADWFDFIADGGYRRA